MRLPPGTQGYGRSGKSTGRWSLIRRDSAPDKRSGAVFRGRSEEVAGWRTAWSTRPSNSWSVRTSRQPSASGRRIRLRTSATTWTGSPATPPKTPTSSRRRDVDGSARGSSGQRLSPTPPVMSERPRWGALFPLMANRLEVPGSSAYAVDHHCEKGPLGRESGHVACMEKRAFQMTSPFGTEDRLTPTGQRMMRGANGRARVDHIDLAVSDVELPSRSISAC